MTWIHICAYLVFVLMLRARGPHRFALFVLSQILFPVNMTAVIRPVNIYSHVLFSFGYFLSVFLETGLSMSFLKLKTMKANILYGCVGFLICFVDSRLALSNKLTRPIMHWFMFSAAFPFMLNDALQIKSLRRASGFLFWGLSASVAYAFACKIIGKNLYHLKISEFSPAPDIANIYMTANERFRVSGFFAHPMDFALFAGWALVLTIQMLEKKLISPWLAAIMAALSGYAVMLANSRLPMLLWICALGYGFLFTKVVGMSRVLKVALLVVFSMGALALTSGGEDDLVGQTLRMFNKEQSVKGSSVEMRLNQLSASTRVAMQRPILGHGLNYILENMNFHVNEEGNTEGVEEDFAGFESILFSVPIEAGYLGLFSIFYFYWSIAMVSLASNRKWTSNYPIVILVLFVTYQVGTGPLGSTALSFSALAFSIRIQNYQPKFLSGAI